jgi:hypothetical protein
LGINLKLKFNQRNKRYYLKHKGNTMKTTQAYIENPVAYENAIKFRIIANANKTWYAKTDRASEIDEALNAGRIQNGYVDGFMGSLAEAYDKYGKLSEKQCQAILKGIDARAMRKVEWSSKKALIDAKRTHVGEIGQKMTFTLTIKKIVSWESCYGTQFLYIMEDAEQNIVIYKGNSAVIAWSVEGFVNEEGTTITFVAIVKEHGVRNEVKQTVIQRPKKV